MKKRKNPDIRALMGLVLLAAALAGTFLLGSESKNDLALAYESGELLRLHVVASSNSSHDQQMKLLVRDELIKEFAGEMSKAGSSREAEEIIAKSGPRIEQAARRAGFEGGISTELGDFAFPDRIYSGTMLPAGMYRAVKIILGEGKGDNWWCVMYPPLCFMDEGEGTELWEMPKVKFKSYFARLIIRLKQGEPIYITDDLEVMANGK
ncbi:MAG: stage II sporulation protein R [Christensenellales bacterium]